MQFQDNDIPYTLAVYTSFPKIAGQQLNLLYGWEGYPQCGRAGLNT